MKKAIKNNCYSKNDSPKNRNSTELHHDCHCERVKRVWQSISTCHAEFISASLDNFYGLLRHFVPRNDCKRAAFTLAEVLITLTIIGVIAALTIPNLLQKWSDHVAVVKVKEAYSILNNAYKMALAENGPREDWGFPYPNEDYKPQNAQYFLSIIKNYLKVKTYCTSSYTDYGALDCFAYGYDSSGNIVKNKKSMNTYVKSVDGQLKLFSNNSNNPGAILLENGMIVIPHIQNPTQDKPQYDSCFTVDINGPKAPNREGYDIFNIGIRMDTLSPRGGYGGDNKSYCKPSGNGSKNYNSCAYWVLRKGNMDYKYRDVSAEW